MSNSIHTSLSDVTHKNPDGINRQKIIDTYLKPDQILQIIPQTESQVLGIYLPIDGQQLQIGTLTRHLSEIVQQSIKDGLPVTIRVPDITSGLEQYITYRVAVEIVFGEGPEPEEDPEPEEIPAVSRNSIQQQMINITAWAGVVILGVLVVLTFFVG